LVVDVSTGGHGNDALEVTVNGELLPNTLVGTELDRDPGAYVVRAHIGAGEAAEQHVDLVTGESRSVRLIVAPPGQPLPPQRKLEGRTEWTPVGWITLSVGAAALIGMGVAIGVRQDALASLQTDCPGYASGTCSASSQSKVDPEVNRGSTASTAVTVLAIGGGLLAGTGLMMLILDGVHPSHEKRVAFGVSPFGGSLLVRFE
jgi:hypothetical protein